MQLFENRVNFSRVADHFSEVMPLMQPMRRAIEAGVPVERRLTELQGRAQDPSNPDFALERQLRALRFYLQQVLFDCSMRWPENMHGSTSYGDLLWKICRWQSDTKEPVTYVTFNYDTLLDRACEQNYDVAPDEQLRHCINSESFKLIKLHGSCDWGRVVRPPLNKQPGGSPPIEERVVHDVTLWMIRAMSETDVTRDYAYLPTPNHVVSPTGEQFARVCLPAIAIPMDKKQEFECPDSHVDVLREMLPQIDRVLIIGWRAAEEGFLSLLQELVPARPRIDLVTASQDDHREVLLRLRTLEPRPLLASPTSPSDFGFSNYLPSNRFEALVGAREVL